MALDSQFARGRQGRNSLMTARRRRRRWRWVSLLLIAVIAGGAWYWWDRSSTSADETLAQYTQSPDDPVVVLPDDEPPAPRPQLVSPEPEPEPEPEPAAPEPTPEPEPRADRLSDPSKPESKAEPETESDPQADEAAERESEPAESRGPDVGSMAWDEVLELIKNTERRVEARRLLSEILLKRAETLSYGDEQLIRQGLTNINLELVYSKQVEPDDPLTGWHTISAGDNLTRIARDHKVTADFLAWINGLESPDRIFAGQKIKVVHGPFHVAVDKSDYRMDIYLTDPNDGQWLYVNSLPVGLGRDDSTPTGRFIVTPKGKVPNPEWTDPRTGKVWDADDPANPIGEYWISLEGAGPETADLRGYGIHGTVDPDSIGDQQSMGCVRLRDRDIQMVYRLLMEGESIAVIKP